MRQKREKLENKISRGEEEINLSDKNTQIRIFIVIFKENFFKNYTEKIY